MRSRRRYQNQIEILQGTLDMLVLRTLLWGAQHGQGIGQAIRANSGELLQVETGSLYPAPHLLAQHARRTKLKTSDKGQRAKYYRLTAAGRKQLLSQESKWDMLVKAIAGVMKRA